MTDGNIQAAHDKLKRAVERLCQPRLAVYHDVTLKAPSLYDTLCGDLAGTQGDNKTPAKSLPPLWIDATQLKQDIDTQARRWTPRCRATTPDRLTMLIQKTWRPQDTKHITQIGRDVNQWCERIMNLIDPESVKHISAPCPSCGKATVWRRDSAGDTVRQPALRVVTNVGCTCQACDATWSPDRYLFLCRLLGFDLPEGVLE
jgi:hypothetical protein